MKANIKANSSRCVEFKDLKFGECFSFYHDVNSSVLMKINACLPNVENARAYVNLTDNRLNFISSVSAEVYKLKQTVEAEFEFLKE